MNNCGEKYHHITTTIFINSQNLLFYMSEEAVISARLDDIVNKIQVKRGVYKPGWGSRNLAETASHYSGKFLDMGAGSGFITLALYMQGKECDAADISRKSLDCAEENFMNFGIFPKMIHSNLYANIDSKYDVVIYNPPKGSHETEKTRLMKNLAQKFVPKRIRDFFEGVYQRFDRIRRRKELLDFVEESEQHLNDDGVLLMNLLPSDATWLRYVDGYKVTEKASNKRRTVVEIKYS